MTGLTPWPEGFAFIRVAPARLPDFIGRILARFLADNFEGDMSWRVTVQIVSLSLHMWPGAFNIIRYELWP